MSDPRPMMTDGEVAFLGRSLKATDRVWEWGSGGSTLWLAKRVRHVTTVEHKGTFAANLIGDVVQAGLLNVSVLHIPQNGYYEDGTEDDGDLNSFRLYVQSYTGVDVDAVLVDGRARVDCCRWLREHAHVGPNPSMRIFLHDCDRKEYAPIFEQLWFTLVERVDNLAMFAPRWE